MPWTMNLYRPWRSGLAPYRRRKVYEAFSHSKLSAKVPAMTPIFLVTSAVMMMAVLSLALWSLQRRANQGMRSLKQAAQKLQALNEVRAAGDVRVNEEQHAALRVAIDEMLRASVGAGRKGRQPAIYATLTLLILAPLAATAVYQSGPPHRGAPGARDLGAHGNGGAAPPIDHGVDMQAAIAKLADKLRQHPNDAEGWALLGRTYKAMRQYPQAREAFRNAMAAAPGDADLAKEYANAQTPNPEPLAMSGTMPQACSVTGPQHCSDRN